MRFKSGQVPSKGPGRNFEPGFGGPKGAPKHGKFGTLSVAKWGCDFGALWGSILERLGLEKQTFCISITGPERSTKNLKEQKSKFKTESETWHPTGGKMRRFGQPKGHQIGAKNQGLQKRRMTKVLSRTEAEVEYPTGIS